VFGFTGLTLARIYAPDEFLLKVAPFIEPLASESNCERNFIIYCMIWLIISKYKPF
jgi:hypothetical protein